ncbi:hypothetical protein ACP4OV_028123 [Aristida adscensionis]
MNCSFLSWLNTTNQTLTIALPCSSCSLVTCPLCTPLTTRCLYDADGRLAAATVSYADYPSFRYSAAADLLSAALQGVAIYLEVAGKEKAAKTVQLIDKLVQALTSTSAALLLAVDDITSCGGARRRGGMCGGGQGQAAGGFCGRVRVSSAFSMAVAVSVSAAIYTRRAPETLRAAPPPTTRRPPAPAREPPRRPDTPPPPPKPKGPINAEKKIVATIPPKQPPSAKSDNNGGGGGKQEPPATEGHCPPPAAPTVGASPPAVALVPNLPLFALIIMTVIQIRNSKCPRSFM